MVQILTGHRSTLGSSRVHTWPSSIVQDIDAQIKLFADGTSLYLVVDVDDPMETAETLNGDLDQIHIWSEKWLVKFNPQKTETIILSKKNNKPNHPPLKMNNSELQKVDNHKHLGVIFSNMDFGTIMLIT